MREAPSRDRPEDFHNHTITAYLHHFYKFCKKKTFFKRLRQTRPPPLSKRKKKKKQKKKTYCLNFIFEKKINYNNKVNLYGHKNIKALQGKKNPNKTKQKQTNKNHKETKNKKHQQANKYQTNQQLM